MKVKVVEAFRYEGKEYSEGSVVDLPESVAKDVIQKDYGHKPEDKTPEFGNNANPSQGNNGSSKSNEPLMSKRVPINSKKRNLKLVVWENEDSLSIALEEGKKSGEDNWQNNRIYLPVAKSFEIAERIKEAGLFVRDRKEG